MNFHRVKGHQSHTIGHRRILKPELLPSQYKFVGERDTQFVGFSGPVGSGKTLALAERAIAMAWINKGLPGIVGAPTYPMLRDATLVHIKDRLHHHSIPYKFNQQEMRMDFPEWKSSILFRSMSHADRLRGQNIAWFGVDEMTYCTELSFMQLEARLRHPLAKYRSGFGVFTPKGFDWVWKRFVSDKKEANYLSIRARPFENSHLPEDYYPNLSRSYSPQFARQEILGEYLNIFSGRAYQQFDRDRNVYPFVSPKHAFQECRYTPIRPILWALDFNINPAASVVAQTIPRVNGTRIAVTDIAGDKFCDVQLNVLDELFLENRTTYDVCEEFLARMDLLREQHNQPRLMIYVYGDASGESRGSNAQRTDYQILREFFERNKDRFQASFRIRTSNPPVKDRVNCMNWICNSATGERRLLVHRRCKNTIADLEQVSWKTNPSGIMRAELDQDTDPMRTHITDALGYLVEREWPMRQRAGLQPGYVA